MANLIYPKHKEALLNKTHDLNNDSIRAILADGADYSYSAAHDFLDDVPGAARVAVSAGLSGATIALGVFDTDDFSWSLVSGDQSEQVILYNHDGNGAGADSARQLMVFFDTGLTGMPVTPSGGNINFTVHASGWYAL